MEQQKALKWWKELPFTKIEGFRTEYEDVIDGMLLDDQIQFIYENEIAKKWWNNSLSNEQRIHFTIGLGIFPKFPDQSQILSMCLAENKSTDCLDCEAYGKYCPSCLPVNPDSPGKVKQEGEEKGCPNCKETNPICACLRNICFKCKEPVGNITFSVCDDCWDKSHLGKKKDYDDIMENPSTPIQLLLEYIETNGNSINDKTITVSEIYERLKVIAVLEFTALAKANAEKEEMYHLLLKLKEHNMCSIVGEELIDEILLRN